MTTQPAPPSPWEHLQNMLMRTYNARVRGYFRANDDDLGDITTPAGSILRACLVVDDDSQLQVLNRQLFFYCTVGAAKDLLDPIVGTPLAEFQAGKKYRPTVTLFFEQDADSVAPSERAAEARISFGVRNETHLTLSEANLQALARSIKSEFGAGGGYRWSKGKKLFTYKDDEGLFNNQIYALNESEAIGVLRKICDVVGVAYNEDFLTEHDPKRSNTANPGTVTVLGRPRKRPKYRPSATVRFRHAVIKIWPLPTPIYLVSYPWRHPNALEFLAA